jgi:ribonuclease Z
MVCRISRKRPSPDFAQICVKAAGRMHLTTAGAIARAAGARQVEPFHLSPRHAGQEAAWRAEIAAAFACQPVVASN